jgi:Protein of unknown function (DUF3108)
MATARRLFGAAAAALIVCVSGAAFGAETAALYHAYWAGLAAGDIRLVLRDDPSGYRDEIAIRSAGLPRLITRFQGTATADGRLAVDRPPEPSHYEAHYDLRKSRDRYLNMPFAKRTGAVIAERGPGDTSKKPPLAEEFRKNVFDPLSALTAIRHELRRGNRASFTVPVYDGARRFNVTAQVLPKKAGDRALHLRLTLSPIAGFKGETSDDGDPDNAPRPVDLMITDDARLLPLSIEVSVAYLPLVVELAKACGSASACSW